MTSTTQDFICRADEIKAFINTAENDISRSKETLSQIRSNLDKNMDGINEKMVQSLEHFSGTVGGQIGKAPS